jgi:hypothetical protein
MKAKLDPIRNRTMNAKILAAFAAAAALAAPSATLAHFTLQAPASWLTEAPNGDPQKMAPCGGVTGNPGMPTGAITAVRGGDMLHVKLQETVFHPGHYRIALSVLDRKELPADPMVMTKEGPRGPLSVSAMIMEKPVPPVLVDGLFPHTERTPPPIPWETDVKLPNINCDKCTLQVIQFMAEHGLNKDGDFSYHHCADLKITANPALPIDRAWPGQTARR